MWECEVVEKALSKFCFFTMCQRVSIDKSSKVKILGRRCSNGAGLGRHRYAVLLANQCLSQTLRNEYRSGGKWCFSLRIGESSGVDACRIYEIALTELANAADTPGDARSVKPSGRRYFQKCINMKTLAAHRCKSRL
jgi:hypothetical protein